MIYKSLPEKPSDCSIPLYFNLIILRMMFYTTDFPNYRQLDQMDCGPTCLKIITKYLGKEFQLDFLRQVFFLQKGGVSFAGLSEALSEIGVDSVGLRTNLHELRTDIPLPAIAHWEGNHFLSFTGLTVSTFLYQILHWEN